eukprot:TRINITY_DN27279_c0_g1_i1.p1 TRINITY_DN27279_c0_g1~~TRINITY_DN27279_c0_g1_i1.p1  ORF type:complete len:321 (+),score=57.77 TRINITY_DN27279_c0_g1_i1:83-1045(+)
MRPPEEEEEEAARPRSDGEARLRPSYTPFVPNEHHDAEQQLSDCEEVPSDGERDEHDALRDKWLEQWRAEHPVSPGEERSELANESVSAPRVLPAAAAPSEDAQAVPEEEPEVDDAVREVLRYVKEYCPTEVELPTRLKPFVPEYIPAVGHPRILAVPCPDGKPDRFPFELLLHEKPGCRLEMVPEDGPPAIQQWVKTRDPRAIPKEPAKEEGEEDAAGSEDRADTPIPPFLTVTEELGKDLPEDLPEDVRRVLDYVAGYVPWHVIPPTILRPFIPDYIPSVAAPDRVLRPPRPDSKEEEFEARFGYAERTDRLREKADT